MTTKAVTADHHAVEALENTKLGVWVIVASEALVFGCLIAVYLSLLGRSTGGPNPSELLRAALPETIVATFVLLLSGFTMSMAMVSIRRGSVGGLQLWTVATMVLGAVFLFFKLKDYVHFYAEGWTLSSNVEGAAFYLLTGTHGAHVAVGLLWLLAVLVNSLRGRYSARNAGAVECAGIYWHFVDMAWMVIFPLVYLLRFAQ